MLNGHGCSHSLKHLILPHARYTYYIQEYAFKWRGGGCDGTVSVPRSNLSFSQIFLKGTHKEKGREKKGGRTLDIKKKGIM